MPMLRAGVAFVYDPDIGDLDPAILLTQPSEPDAVTDLGFRRFAVTFLVTVLYRSSAAAAPAGIRALPVLVVVSA